MKKIMYIQMLLVVSTVASYAQEHMRNRFPVGSFHKPNQNINGFSVGLWSLADDEKNINTNGVKLEAIGLGAILPLVPSDPLGDKNFPKDKFSERINGISISGTGTVCNCRITGASFGTVGQLVTNINGISAVILFNLVREHRGLQLGMISAATKMRGVQFGFFSSTAGEARGIQIGTLNNIRQGRGIQIGLFNRAANFKGLQIGLYNKNQYRTTPFINWNFKG